MVNEWFFFFFLLFWYDKECVGWSFLLGINWFNVKDRHCCMSVYTLWCIWKSENKFHPKIEYLNAYWGATNKIFMYFHFSILRDGMLSFVVEDTIRIVWREDLTRLCWVLHTLYVIHEEVYSWNSNDFEFKSFGLLWLGI